MDPLHPSTVFDPQIAVELQASPPLQHLLRRDVALGQPACFEKLPKVPQTWVDVVRVACERCTVPALIPDPASVPVAVVIGTERVRTSPFV